MARRLALSWLVIAACGRIRFDAIPVDAASNDAGDSRSPGCVVQVLSNSDTTCARTTSGKLWCWGANASYEIGDGTVMDRPSPAQTQLPIAVIDAALGSAHGCALDASHAVWCWGTNQNGAIGDGTTANTRPTPVSATAVPSGVYQDLDAGAHFTCAIDGSGETWCWGIDNNSQLGDNGTVDSHVPVMVVGAANVVELQSASYTTCARDTTGKVLCWSRNDFGQFGNGSTAMSGTAVTTAFPLATSLSTGGSLTSTPTAGHTCVVAAADGSVHCSGSNSYGQLGDGTTTPAMAPVLATIPSASQVAAGTWHTCALSGGHVACWGRNDSGELGRGIATPYETDAIEIAGLSGVVTLAVGRDQTCALLGDSTIACWGGNDRGQVGDGTMSPRLSPIGIDVPCP